MLQNRTQSLRHQSLDPKELLLYWITEREIIRQLKESGLPKPWSLDYVMQETYFCNVRREHDKVTQWIRKFYNPHVKDEMFEFNIILSRFLNWPETLDRVGYYGVYNKGEAEYLLGELEHIATEGKVWGNAYVITTHGIPMPKAKYLCENVLLGALEGLGATLAACRGTGSAPTLQGSYGSLLRLEGLGSFLAAQVVADLKNTPGHPLQRANDWYTFVAPGPGSRRGISWFYHNTEEHPPSSYEFIPSFKGIRDYINEHWDKTVLGEPICNQDLQNCLCEFDKFMRVRNGKGRSKRSYNGG